MDGSQGEFSFESPIDPSAVRRFLADNPDFLKADQGLLAELGLTVASSSNVVEFAPMARVHAAHQREAEQRALLEEIARANFAAQAQTHGAVVDLLDARNLSDLARRVDDLARTRFGLAAGMIALECEGLPPAGWRSLVEGQVDLILDGPRRMARMGFAPTALGLFAPDAGEIRSMAMVRMAMWEPSRQGLLAFGSASPDDFTPDMGAELVAFLARVVERTAERWPLL
ncbi:MAG: DUF484 family protein [Phenylobacterium sp.]|jgi:uncharacterized protein YigA (DUF484 family)|uniref:DUF484 family protein n=1 Tax=unclassified Phenylobacterium TaxID=2640670 RepID=UPI0008AAC2CE|nr:MULTISPECIES: DUF484 family protein [unclassified Phenylobacterium]MBJ7412392.1 DUF484 family protein [Phenylobacterium sp.]OHB29468.1 MAG: hypothetical protein A2790_05975 [Phenylobacterium sp. RIFCSPHIGHO2_01_FULL_69_31]